MECKLFPVSKATQCRTLLGSQSLLRFVANHKSFGVSIVWAVLILSHGYTHAATNTRHTSTSVVPHRSWSVDAGEAACLIVEDEHTSNLPISHSRQAPFNPGFKLKAERARGILSS